MDLEHPTFVAQGGFRRLKEIRRLLDRHGVRSEIVGPPDGRTNA
jgi:hypothetical protein